MIIPPHAKAWGIGLRLSLWWGRFQSGAAGRSLRVVYRIVLFAAVTLLLVSCVPASAPPTIKVGLVAPFSGREAALGYNMLFAARLALKEWNERGGVGGYYVELVAQDDRNGAEMGAVQARKMVLDPQVVGVIGHPSRESALAAAPVYRQAGLPVLLVGAALSEDEAGGLPIFQLGPMASELAREAARFASSQGSRRLALVSEGGRLAQELGQAARNAGLEVTFNGVVAADKGEDARLLEALKEARPDLVFYEGGYVEGGALLAGLRAQGLEAAFLGGPGLTNPDLLKIAGPAAEGAYYLSTAPFPRDAADAPGFVAAYRALAGTEPWPQALVTYDALNAMLKALERASKAGQRPRREALWQGLAQQRYQGLGSAIAFDGQGNQIGARGYIYHIEGMVWPGRLLR